VAEWYSAGSAKGAGCTPTKAAACASLAGSATMFSRSNNRRSCAVSGLPVVSSFSP
jgi:hypothetical protein